VLLYLAVFATLSIQTWAAFTRYDADLAINDQLVWNASRLRPFQSTLIGHARISLGDHFSFYQLLLAPLYWLWPDPRTLLLAQTAGLALAAVPLGWIADLRLKDRALGSGLVVLFLAYPPLHFLNLFEYHEVAWAVPALAFLLWALVARRYRLAWLFFLLSLAVKEELAIVGAAIGLFVALVERQRRLGMAFLAVAVAWGVLAMAVVMPQFNEAGGGFYYLRRYSQYGSSAFEIGWYLVTHPTVVLGELLSPARLTYYLQLLLPLAGLPLLAPAALAPALPTVVYLALGNSPAQYSIQYHYQAPLIPLLLFATTAGLVRLRRWGLPRGLALAGLLATAGLGYLALSPAPLGRAFEPERYHGGEHALLLEQFISRVPPDTPISAARNVVSRFSRRERVYNFPTVADAELVLLDYRGLFCCGFWEDDDQALRRFVASGQFWLVDALDGIWLFARGTPQPPAIRSPLAVTIGDLFRLAGYDLTVRDASTAQLRLWWQALRPPGARYTVFLHVLDQQGRRVWQHDSEPLDGLFPTAEWPPGWYLPDVRRLDLGALAAGEYRVYVGMYEWGGGDRLPIPATHGTEFPDAYLLLSLHLPFR
jgi:uncharacterized membrane protein